MTGWYLPFRRMLPALLGSFALLISLLAYLNTRPLLLSTVEEQALIGLRTELTELQGVLQILLRQGNLEGARSVVASTGADPDHQMILLTDAGGSVLAATRWALVGRSWRDIDEPLDGALIETVIGGRQTSARSLDTGDSITGYTSICVRDAGRGLRPNRCGFLYYRQDLARRTQKAVETLRLQSLQNAVGILALVFVLWGVLHFSLTSRVQKLVRTARRFGRGDESARSGLAGGDELAQVSRAFDSLLDTVAADQQKLRVRDRAMAASSNGIVIADASAPDNPIVYCNPAFEKITGYPLSEVIGRNCRFLQGEAVDQPRLAEVRAALQEERECRVILRNYRKDGAPFWNELHLAPVRDPKGAATHFVGILDDISDRKQAEEDRYAAYLELERRVETRTAELSRVNASLVSEVAERRQAERSLFREKERAQVTLESIGDAVITTSAAGAVEYLNPVAESLTGWSAQEAAGKPLETVFHVISEATGERVANAVTACLQSGRTTSLDEEAVLVSRAGRRFAVQNSASPIRDRAGEVLGAVLVFSDVTESRRMTREITHQATHDDLTGLANRREFERRLQRSLETAKADRIEHTLCYLDLDQFKVINDTCGHVAGDELLRQLAGLFRERVRKRDTLARLGGDEFAILMEHCSCEQAERLVNLLRQTVADYRFGWEDKAFAVGVSIGLVPLNAESGDLNSVLRAADTACYAAKDAGRNRVHVYRKDDVELARRRGEMQWVGEINRALEADRFLLHGQEIRRVSGGERSALFVELLLRMQTRQGELVPPAKFLPAAERYGLMVKLDRWVVKAAFRWLAGHPPGLAADGLCSINLSGQSVSDAEFLAYVQKQMQTWQVDPRRVCFEITETAAISNLASASHFIRVLKDSGCWFALDDFGSGLSSFAYLKNLPVDFLKIDGQFVRDIEHDAIDFAMVKSINEIGHVMHKRTIAEFVENDAILDRLREIGVDYAQGFGVSRPRPLSELRRSAVAKPPSRKAAPWGTLHKSCGSDFSRDFLGSTYFDRD